MRITRYVLLAAVLGGVAACDEGTTTSPPATVPTAAVRFINAVPDTMALDYRFVDFVTNAGMFNAAFRANQPNYQPVNAGQHTFRVFLSCGGVTPCDPAIASTVVHEQAFTFAASASYTVVHSGFLRAGSAPAGAVAIQEDNPPTPAAGKVALRALHLGAGMGAVDVFVGTTTTAGETPSPTATWTNLAYGASTPYVEFDAAALRVAATATTTTTPLLLANTAAPAGAPAVGTGSPITGVQIAGSVLTVVILPPSVVGSMAPQSAAFTVPAFAFLNDRRPPN